MGLFAQNDDDVDKQASLPISVPSFVFDSLSEEITAVKTPKISNESGVTLAVTVDRRSTHSNGPWPSNEEFAPFYESTTSVDTSIWKSGHRKPNEMPKLVTKKELASHKRKIDAWMGLFGKVFDCSGFVDRHPGGYEMIEQGIGRDATEMFKKAHSYVDYENILVRDFIGIYMPQVPKRVTKMKGRKWRHGFCVCHSSKNKKDLKTKFDIKFTENLDFLALHISAKPGKGIVLRKDSWSVILWDSQYLLVKTVLTPPTCWVAEYCLKLPISYEYLYIDFKNDFKRITILFKKPKPLMWKTLGEPNLENNCSVIRADEIEDETPCHLFYRKQLTQHIILVGFKIRPSSFLSVPIGYSIRVTINGVSNWYTPVVFSLLNQPEPECSVTGESIFFIMKISPGSILSRMVNEFHINPDADEGPGSYITMGCALGTFNFNFLEDVDVLVLLAEGTGITPMIRIIKYYLDRDQGSLKEKHVILFYFNENESDIFWSDVWTVLDDQNEWFNAFLVFEEADSEWEGLRGQLSVHLVKWCLDAVSGVSSDLRMKAVASGDEAFINSCDRLFNFMKDYFDKTFTFLDVYG